METSKNFWKVGGKLVERVGKGDLLESWWRVGGNVDHLRQ
jgi:hypothetical protein